MISMVTAVSAASTTLTPEDARIGLSTAMIGGVIIFSVGMYFYRKFTAGESFDLKKFVPTIVYAIIIAVTAFITTGLIPNSGDILASLEAGIPDTATFLTLGTTLVALILNKYKGTTTQVTNVTVPQSGVVTPSSAAGTPVGKAKVLGIYVGSAGSGIPSQSVKADVNQIGTMFFDLLGIVTGSIAMRLSIDGQVRTKWTTADADQSLIGVVVTNLTYEQVNGATRLPKAFYIPTSMQTPGTHEIKVELGYMDSTGFIINSTDKFTLELTGVKLTE